MWPERTSTLPELAYRGHRPDAITSAARPILWALLWAGTCGPCRRRWRWWSQLDDTGRQGRWLRPRFGRLPGYARLTAGRRRWAALRAVATGQASGFGRCYMPPPCFAGRPVARATLRSWKTTVG